ncbi:RNA polymerase sigma factor [Polyangium mundeleinium]|uniref:Sigma factor n=1 Tax=Polyangium mundeleinium TaxID=2995306 RepID=A0ABT5F2Q9_9BACT|nr:sigma factor [Polyangium mundeleinium]MDC0748384.1 sigma factor [Polyangium mundeleinium]
MLLLPPLPVPLPPPPAPARNLLSCSRWCRRSNPSPHPESAKKPARIPSSQASFERFYRECRPFVRSTLLQRGVPEREVDDLVQEVFIIAWRDGSPLPPRRRVRYLWPTYNFTCEYNFTVVGPAFLSGVSNCAGNKQMMTADRTCP